MKATRLLSSRRSQPGRRCKHKVSGQGCFPLAEAPTCLPHLALRHPTSRRRHGPSARSAPSQRELPGEAALPVSIQPAYSLLCAGEVGSNLCCLPAACVRACFPLFKKQKLILDLRERQLPP